MVCVALFCTGVFFFGPGNLQAQTATEQQCTCFCSSEQGTAPGPKMTKTECAQSCLAKGNTMVTCAYSANQYPDRANLKCFKQKECESEPYFGIFDKNHQPPDCPAGKHLCFPKPEPIALSVNIGSTTHVLNLGEYIKAGYDYAIGISLIIVTVLIMIGGVQWILAAGVSSQLSAAKKRIWNAITGLIIIVCAALILETVNPALLILTPPKANLLKRIVLLTEETSCEDLIRAAVARGESPDQVVRLSEATQGKYKKLECGSVAPVLKGLSGDQVTDGSTCQFETCQPDGTGTKRLCAGIGDRAVCTSCQEVFPTQTIGSLGTGTNVSGVAPSSSVCQQLSPDVFKGGLGYSGKSRVCFWTSEAGLAVDGLTAVQAATALVAPQNVFAGLAGIEAVSAMTQGTCAEISIECQKIKSCRDYDDILAQNKIENECLDDINPYLGTDLDLARVCSTDPCGVAPTGESCEHVEWLTRDDCMNSEAAKVLNAVDWPDLESTVDIADVVSLQSCKGSACTPIIALVAAKYAQRTEANLIEGIRFSKDIAESALKFENKLKDRDGKDIDFFTAGDTCSFLQ